MSEITVTGEGRAAQPPDIVRLSLGVSALDKNASKARERAAAAMASMLSSLRALALTDADLQTETLRVQPEYDYDGGTQRLRGYRVAAGLRATVAAVAEAGEVLEAALAAGGDLATVQGLAFEARDRAHLEQEAMRRGFADARAKAEALAAAAGVKLGPPLNIDARNPADGGIPRPMAFAAEARTALPLEPGEIEAVARVTVTFALVAG